MGGQSVVNFDYSMAEGVMKTFVKKYTNNLEKAIYLLFGVDNTKDALENIVERIKQKFNLHPCLDKDLMRKYLDVELVNLKDVVGDVNLDDERYSSVEDVIQQAQKFSRNAAEKETDRATYQAMEAFVHNLNTMHSRAGAQVPFSSINYGMDTSPEARMAIKNLLLTTEAGLGDGETPIFPIQIFRVKEGVNFNPGDPNYDLFKLAIRCSAKRLFPNFSFIDAPFNKMYYKEGHPETEIAYMGEKLYTMAHVKLRELHVVSGVCAA